MLAVAITAISTIGMPVCAASTLQAQLERTPHSTIKAG